MIGNDENPDFMGLGKFVWWFGVVEDRLDPLNLGRCKVRCFGWHTNKQVEIPTDSLPWAHPVVPYGTKSVQPPTEGTMVFGFFADGKEGRYPIIMGTVPGIPEELRGANSGFSDPYTATEKATSTNPVFPRKIVTSAISTNAAGPAILDDYAKRYPDRLDEPTVSRLARPDRIESANTGSSLGVRSASIEGTPIDFQRKNRVVKIRSARFRNVVDKVTRKKKRVQTVWNEPFPSYNAKYPFNNVTETESGHAFELDDTPDYERVQLSHRTGSTLEFMPSGSIKEKSFNNKYSIVMGNERKYVNGAKEETIQSNMFLKVDGELVIQCNGLRIESVGDINMSGHNVKITAQNNIDIAGAARANVYGGGIVNVRAEGILGVYGGYSASLHSGGLTSVTGNPITDITGIGAVIKQSLASKGIELGNPATALNSGVIIGGPNLWIETVLTTFNSAVTNILPTVAPSPEWPKDAGRGRNYSPPLHAVKPTKPGFKKEPTDSMGFLEKSKVTAPQAEQ